MRIAIINITGGGISGGYKKYLINILPKLANHKVVEKILCATPNNIKIMNWMDDHKKISHVKCNNYKPFFHKLDLELRKQLEIFRPDIIFVPVERFFSFKNIPVVTMLQTMEPLVKIQGNNFIEKFIQYIQYKNAKKALTNSKRIIALSNFVKDEIVNQWMVPLNNIKLIYHGINIPHKTNKELKEVNGVHARDDFFFTAGSLRPARGLEDILEAFLKYKKNIDCNSKLIIAGRTSPRMVNYVEKLKKWTRNNRIDKNIIWFDNLNLMEMEFFYKNSSAFIMSSRVESFGMIAGEAMACGSLCISADNPCLPEIFSGTAILYKNGNSHDLFSKLDFVTKLSSKDKEKYIKNSVKRSKFFSWDICAEKTVECLLNVLKIK